MFISIHNASISTRHGFINVKKASPVSATASVRNTYPAAFAGAVVVAGTSAGARAGAAFVGAVARHFRCFWNRKYKFLFKCYISMAEHILFCQAMEASYIGGSWRGCESTVIMASIMS